MIDTTQVATEIRQLIVAGTPEGELLVRVARKFPDLTRAELSQAEVSETMTIGHDGLQSPGSTRAWKSVTVYWEEEDLVGVRQPHLLPQFAPDPCKISATERNIWDAITKETQARKGDLAWLERRPHERAKIIETRMRAIGYIEGDFNLMSFLRTLRNFKSTHWEQLLLQLKELKAGIPDQSG